jgi:heme a synthase
MYKPEHGVVGGWLLWVAAGIFVMVVIGGVTRLTDSGLSITEWRLVSGVVPPVTHRQWEEAFAKYKGTPQHELTFPDIDLAGFQRIYWWEYIHRLWGRALGLAFALPLAWFAVRRRLPKGLWKWLWGALALGGAQGFLGWFMVQSGLVDRPWVSPVRLTAHLLLALGLFSIVFYWGARLWRPAGAAAKPGLSAALVVLTVLLLVQMAWGGLLAGNKAAPLYPTFPTLNGEWWPALWWRAELGMLNFLENGTLIHLGHRLTAVAVAVAAWVFARASRGASPPGRGWMGFVIPLGVALQLLLGIWTVLESQGRVPAALGVLHQAVAVVLWAGLLLWWAALADGRKGSAA